MTTSESQIAVGDSNNITHIFLETLHFDFDNITHQM